MPERVSWKKKNWRCRDFVSDVLEKNALPISVDLKISSVHESLCTMSDRHNVNLARCLLLPTRSNHKPSSSNSPLKKFAGSVPTDRIFHYAMLSGIDRDQKLIMGITETDSFVHLPEPSQGRNQQTNDGFQGTFLFLTTICKRRASADADARSNLLHKSPFSCLPKVNL